MKIAIITDSGCGLSVEAAKKEGIFMIPLQIIEGDQSMRDCYDITTIQLYDDLKKGIMPKTSMPLGEDVEAIMDAIIKEGYSEAIVIPLSSGLSGTHQIISMVAEQKKMALKMVEISTTCAIQKYLSKRAVALVKEGKSSDEIESILKKAVQTNYTYILPNDLQHLKRGGRLTPLAASMASLLKIKPILRIAPDTEGKIDVAAKVRTESKAIKTALDKMVDKMGEDAYEVFVINSDCEERAKMICKMFDECGKDVHAQVDIISSVIASHTGLDCIALQMIKKM